MNEQDAAFYDDPSGDVVYDGTYYYDGSASPGSERNQMAEIKTDLSNQSVPTIITNGENIAEAMGGSATYQSIHDKTTVFSGKVATLKSAHKAVKDNEAEHKQLVILLHNALAAYKTGYVQFAKATMAVDDSPGALASGRWEIRNAGNTPVGPLPAPEEFTVTAGDFEGQIDLACDGDPRVAFWKGEMAEDSDGPWTPVYQGTCSNWSKPGLTPGKLYWFRMCAHGAAGDSPWSPALSKRAP